MEIFFSSSLKRRAEGSSELSLTRNVRSRDDLCFLDVLNVLSFEPEIQDVHLRELRLLIEKTNNRRGLVKPDYNKTQGWNCDLRVNLAQFLCDCAKLLTLDNETSATAVFYLDVFLSEQKMDSSALVPLAGACLWLAVKFLETTDDMITLKDFAQCFRCSAATLLKFEAPLLKRIQWNASFVTSVTALRRLMQMVPGHSLQWRRYAELFVDSLIRETRGLLFTPFISALAAASCASVLVECNPEGLALALSLVDSKEELDRCCDLIWEIHSRNGNTLPATVVRLAEEKPAPAVSAPPPVYVTPKAVASAVAASAVASAVLAPAAAATVFVAPVAASAVLAAVLVQPDTNTLLPPLAPIA